MRKLKLAMQITLDGFAAGPNGENDWMFLPGKLDPAALQSTINLAASSDTLLLGRKMTGEFCKYWETVADNEPDSPWYPLAQLLVNHRKIVFSRTETVIGGRNVEVENGDLTAAVQALKSQTGKDLLVYGGVNFASSLIDLNLIDEYYILINPVAIGSGQSIFKERKLLELQSATAFKNGKVLHKYVPV